MKEVIDLVICIYFIIIIIIILRLKSLYVFEPNTAVFFIFRVCRLKKKAQHEANKIKLYGLQQEHSMNIFCYYLFIYFSLSKSNYIICNHAFILQKNC